MDFLCLPFVVHADFCDLVTLKLPDEKNKFIFI